LSTTTQGATDVSADKTAFVILAAISFCHLLNDMMQSLLPAIYPILKSNYNLDFGQIGVITFTWQITASLLQPIIGSVIDRRPKPYSLAVGMGFTLMGLVLLSVAGNFGVLLLAAALVGTGSAVFHPESSRVARMASGGRHGLAQSVFQVGGNAGSAIGPLLAAFIVLRYGQTSVAWFALAALLGIFLLTHVGHWYKLHGLARIKARASRAPGEVELPRGRVAVTIAVLIALIFSKFFYMASMTSYYTFYLIHGFGVSVHTAQIHLFVFLAAVAVGTVAGGPIGDRFGRKAVIWASILGVLPFTLALPYANLFWTGVLSVPIGIILASAFPAVVVYAQELLPKRVGAVAGLFSGWPLASAASVLPCWVNWRMQPASTLCSIFVRSCRRSACWPRFCRILRPRAVAGVRRPWQWICSAVPMYRQCRRRSSDRHCTGAICGLGSWPGAVRPQEFRPDPSNRSRDWRAAGPGSAPCVRVLTLCRPCWHRLEDVPPLRWAKLGAPWTASASGPMGVARSAQTNRRAAQRGSGHDLCLFPTRRPREQDDRAEQAKNSSY